MPLDPTTNFAQTTITAGTLLTAAATTFDVATGTGALFPATAGLDTDGDTLGSYKLTVWCSSDFADPKDDPSHEIIKVTAHTLASDTFTTIVRAQEGTTAVAHNDSTKTYSVALCMTEGFVEDIPVVGFTNMRRQALINGNFDVWQRATTSTAPITTAYVADRWQNLFVLDSGTNPTLIHSRQLLTSGDLPGSYYHYRINANGAGSSYGVNSYNVIAQWIENGVRNLCGASRQVTISFWAKSSVSGKKIGVYIDQYYGTGGSPTAIEEINGTNFTLTSSWAKYSYTFTTNTLVGKTFGTNNNDALVVLIGTQWGATFGSHFGTSSAETYGASGNTDIAQVVVSTGAKVLKFCPKSFEDELRDCQRYYEKSFAYATAPAQNVGSNTGEQNFTAALAGANAMISPSVYFKVTKRTSTPTMTLYNPSATNAQIRNLTAAADFTASAAIQNDGSFVPYGTGTAGTTVGQQLIVHWTADAEF